MKSSAMKLTVGICAALMVACVVLLMWPEVDLSPPTLRYVSCYSGNKTYFTARAKDDVSIRNGALQFTDFDTDRSVIVLGNCVVEYL